MSNIEFACTIIGAVVAVIGGVWALFTFVFKIGRTKEHVDMFEQNTDKKFENVDKRLDKDEEILDSHTRDIISIITFLGQKYPKNADLFSLKHSPRKLNQLGEELYEKVGGAEFLSTNKEKLYELIDKEKPQTRLDVESASLTALMLYLSSPAFNRIKDIIYDMPSIDTGKGKYEVTMSDVCFVLSLPLRDMYIKDKNVK